VTRSALPRIALLALIWGSAFLWIKLADRGFSAVEVTLARLALGAAVLFAIVRVRREQVPRSGPLWVHIAVAALFANAVPYLLFAVAEQTVDSATAGIINATTPLWTVVLALAVRHQKNVTGWQAAGLVVGFAGAVLIFTPWHTAGGLFSVGGLECLAASVVIYATRRGVPMTEPSLPELEATRDRLHARLAAVGDFRRGSVSQNYRKCGKPNCACAAPDHRGHGPRFLWTRSAGARKTVGRQLAAAEVEKVRRELARHAEFTAISEQIAEVNERICEARPVAGTAAPSVPESEKGGSARRSRGRKPPR